MGFEKETLIDITAISELPRIYLIKTLLNDMELGKLRKTNI